MVSFKLKFRPSTTPNKAGTLYFQVIHHRDMGQTYLSLAKD